MQITTNNPTPTPTAIDRAIRNALTSTRQLHQSKSVASTWFLVNPENPADYWMVNAEFRTCDCPAFAREGVCKHQVMVDDEIAVREAEAGREAAEEDEAARYAL